MNNESKSPLVIEEEKAIPVTSEIEKKATTAIPNDYICVKFESMGALQDCPKELHIRDYTLNDALRLNVSDEEEQIKALISVINDMIYEDYDVSNLHPNDFMMLLYSVHGKFISAKIEKEYVLDETLEEGNKEGQRYHPSNVASIEIPLSKLMIHNIHDDLEGKKRPDTKVFGGRFKEPIKIKNDESGTTFGFRISRMKDILVAQEYCKEKYAEQLRDFAPIKRNLYKLVDSQKKIEDREKALDALIDSDPDTYEAYQKFITFYNLDYAKIIQTCTIDGKVVDNTYIKFENLDDKIEAYNNDISTGMWSKYNFVVAEYPFGIDEKYEFFCDKYQRNITRRFSFQFLDFLPAPNPTDSGRFTVLFD